MPVYNRLGEHIDRYFGFLVSEHGFVKGEAASDRQSFEIVFHSKTFNLKIQTYHRGIDAYLCKPIKPDDEINLFLLLQFLYEDTNKKISSNYFADTKDLDETYRLQIKWIAAAIESHLNEIKAFFAASDFEKSVIAVRQYVIAKNPELFARCGQQ
ncbi:MAG: hypothetical protein WCP86_12210 [bacterium]|jgi:hypothetical protein